MSLWDNAWKSGIDLTNCTIFTNQSDTREPTGNKFFFAKVTWVFPVIVTAVLLESYSDSSASLSLNAPPPPGLTALPTHSSFLSIDTSPVFILEESSQFRSESFDLVLLERSIGSSWKELSENGDGGKGDIENPLYLGNSKLDENICGLPDGIFGDEIEWGGDIACNGEVILGEDETIRGDDEYGDLHGDTPLDWSWGDPGFVEWME